MGDTENDSDTRKAEDWNDIALATRLAISVGAAGQRYAKQHAQLVAGEIDIEKMAEHAVNYVERVRVAVSESTDEADDHA